MGEGGQQAASRQPSFFQLLGWIPLGGGRQATLWVRCPGGQKAYVVFTLADVRRPIPLHGHCSATGCLTTQWGQSQATLRFLLIPKKNTIFCGDYVFFFTILKIKEL